MIYLDIFDGYPAEDAEWAIDELAEAKAFLDRIQAGAEGMTVIDEAGDQHQLVDLLAVWRAEAMADVSGPACRVCGCTENDACLGDDGLPCHWVEAELCSSCYAKSGVGMLAHYPPIDELSPEMQELVDQDPRA